MKTYNEWLAKGRHVMKGQKAAGRNSEGVAVFKKSQTAELDYYPYYGPSTNYRSTDYNDIDYDDPITFDPWMFS